MSYKCHFCGRASEPHEPMNLVVTKTRRKGYPVVDQETGEIIDETPGWEVLEEKPSCSPCKIGRETLVTSTN